MSRPAHVQDGNQRGEAGSAAATTAQGSGGGDLRDRVGNGDSSSGRLRRGGEADDGDPGNEQGRNGRQPSSREENGADAERSTKAAHEASHSKPTVPPLDLSLQPS